MAETDHVARFDAKVDALGAYRGKPNFRALAVPLLDDMNNVERIVTMLLAWAQVDGKVGEPLARVGRAVGLANPGEALPDTIFRRFVYAKILANHSGVQRVQDLTVDGAVKRRALETVARALQVRAIATPVVVQIAFPFTWVVVIPGLVGVEGTAAYAILKSAIAACDRLFLYTPSESQPFFQYDTLFQGYDEGVWLQEMGP